MLYQFYHYTVCAGGVVVELVKHDTVDQDKIPCCLTKFACLAVRERLAVESG